MALRPLSLAVVGAASPAGAELAQLLEEHELALSKVTFLDRNSLGEEIFLAGADHSLVELTAEALAASGAEVVIVLPGSSATPELLAQARATGALVLDASGVSREDPAIPLLFPGINDEELEALPAGRVLAIPSPGAAQLAAVLLPLEAAAGLVAVTVTSLQSAAAGGLAGAEELSKQTTALLGGREPERARFPHRLAFNLIPQVEELDGSGVSGGERRLAQQASRLLGSSARLSVTALLAPLFYGQTQVLRVELARPLPLAKARELFRGAPELKLLDDPAQQIYPMPLLAVGEEAVLVGRLRADALALSLVSVCDELRFGTALPLVRLLRLLLERGLL